MSMLALSSVLVSCSKGDPSGPKQPTTVEQIAGEYRGGQVTLEDYGTYPNYIKQRDTDLTPSAKVYFIPPSTARIELFTTIQENEPTAVFELELTGTTRNNGSSVIYRFYYDNGIRHQVNATFVVNEYKSKSHFTLRRDYRYLQYGAYTLGSTLKVDLKKD
jgi:hypothetical protein